MTSDPADPPRILQAPDPVLVDEGGSAELQCEAEGKPMGRESLQWGRLVWGDMGLGGWGGGYGVYMG